MIDTRKQYIRTQISRWDFYNALEEVQTHPLANPALDPQMTEVYRKAILSQIEDLEQELAEYEAKHGPWVNGKVPE